MIDLKDRFKECIELMQRDVAVFEAKYQGRFAEQPHVGLGNRKTRCVNEANRRAEKQAEQDVHVWHCRDCASHGCGCCGTGDIRFNVVGESGWAERAESKNER